MTIYSNNSRMSSQITNLVYVIYKEGIVSALFLTDTFEKFGISMWHHIISYLIWFLKGKANIVSAMKPLRELQHQLRKRTKCGWSFWTKPKKAQMLLNLIHMRISFSIFYATHAPSKISKVFLNFWIL